MNPQVASPSPTPRPSTPPNAYTLTLHLSPWSFARLFHSTPSSPQRTRTPQSATPPDTADSQHTPTRRSQHHHDSPETDEEEWSDHAHSDGELSLLYASPRNEPSLLYTVRRSPARFTAWDDSDLLQLDTPPPRSRGSVEDTPRPPRGGCLETVEEYHLELPTARCLWEWRWAMAAAAGFFVGWGAGACGRYGVSVVAALVFAVAVRCG